MAGWLGRRTNKPYSMEFRITLPGNKTVKLVTRVQGEMDNYMHVVTFFKCFAEVMRLLHWHRVILRSLSANYVLDIFFSISRWKYFCRSWWRHQKEAFSALLAICAGSSPVTGEFPAQRPLTRSFDVFCDLRLNKRLRKQSWIWS